MKSIKKYQKYLEKYKHIRCQAQEKHNNSKYEHQKGALENVRLVNSSKLQKTKRF